MVEAFNDLPWVLRGVVAASLGMYVMMPIAIFGMANRLDRILKHLEGEARVRDYRRDNR